MARRTELAKRLEQARTDAGLTVEQATRALRLSKTSVLVNYERRLCRRPSEAMLERIVETYTATEKYLDSVVLYDPNDDATAVPPDVLLSELLLLRNRRRGSGSSGAVSTIIALLMPVCCLFGGGCEAKRVEHYNRPLAIAVPRARRVTGVRYGPKHK